MTADEIEAAAARVRDQYLAMGVAYVVALAVKHHPEIMRTALRSVFDLSAVEVSTARIEVDLAALIGRAIECRELIGQVQVDIEMIERRFDAARMAIETIERRIAKAAGVVQQLR